MATLSSVFVMPWSLPGGETHPRDDPEEVLTAVPAAPVAACCPLPAAAPLPTRDTPCTTWAPGDTDAVEPAGADPAAAGGASVGTATAAAASLALVRLLPAPPPGTTNQAVNATTVTAAMSAPTRSPVGARRHHRRNAW